jgi:hypothetical protein
MQITDLSLQRKVGKEDKEMVIIKQIVNRWLHSAWDLVIFKHQERNVVLTVHRPDQFQTTCRLYTT